MLCLMRSTARRLTSPKAIVAYIVMLLVIINNAVGAIANIDFVLAAQSNSRLAQLWNFLITPKGNFIAVVLAVLWITALLLWPEKKSEQGLLAPPPEQSPPRAQESDAQEGEDSESTLVCVNTRIADIWFIHGFCTENIPQKNVRAPVVAFGNKGNPASMKNEVKARITFYDSKGKHLRHINNGVWLEEERTSIEFFDVGEVRELVIALMFMPSSSEAYAFDSQGMWEITPAGKELRVEVSLVGGLFPATLGIFNFKLTFEPEIAIEEIKTG